MTITEEDLKNRFNFHPATEISASKHEKAREAAHTLARIFNELCPDSREKSLAITSLEESLMWANAAIARNQ